MEQSLLLRATGFHVRFGALHALRSVNLQLFAGDLLGLIGPNGAGKTTFLRALAGLQPIDAGRLEVLGEPVLPNGHDHLRRIGFTPDTPSVYETLTVRDFLRYVAFGYNIHSTLIDERIDFWLEKVWLAEKRNQRIKGLSRGMRQRLGIARTLLADPVIVLLDEPAAGLDPAGRVQFRELLVSLRNQGKALIVSSHILADMNEYCTHIGIMSQGQIVRAGTVEEIARHGQENRCRIAMTLAGAVNGMADFLTALPGVADIQLDGEKVEFQYHSDKQEIARLLALLVGRGYPIASFSPRHGGLEEAYMRAGIGQVD